jgi:hypothetical protein
MEKVRDSRRMKRRKRRLRRIWEQPRLKEKGRTHRGTRTFFFVLWNKVLVMSVERTVCFKAHSCRKDQHFHLTRVECVMNWHVHTVNLSYVHYSTHVDGATVQVFADNSGYCYAPDKILDNSTVLSLSSQQCILLFNILVRLQDYGCLRPKRAQNVRRVSAWRSGYTKQFNIWFSKRANPKNTTVIMDDHRAPTQRKFHLRVKICAK